MTTLSQERREWIHKMFPRDAAAMIREIESLPTEAEANKMVTRLKDAINTQFAHLPPSEHPGIGYYGQAFKSMGSQRPAPTLADLQQQQQAMNARLKALNRAQKDAAETADAQAVLDLMELADRLELNQDAVMKLVTQYGLAEVTGILRTLTQQKAAKGSYYSPFYGCQMKTVDIADVRLFANQQHAEKSMKDSPNDSFFS